MVTHLPAVGVVVGRAAAGGAVWKMQAVSPVTRRWTCCRATCGMPRRSRITPGRRSWDLRGYWTTRHIRTRTRMLKDGSVTKAGVWGGGAVGDAGNRFARFE
jgi:hypothetical protein